MNSLLKNPYLIQRGVIREPISFSRGMPIHQAVHLDYMGAAQFGSSRLQSSLEALRLQVASMRVQEVPMLTRNGQPLMVIHTFGTNEWFDYTRLLLALHGQKHSGIYTLEPTGFDPDQPIELDNKPIDFWWDLNNNTMFSFNKEFMSSITEYVRESWSTPVFKSRPGRLSDYPRRAFGGRR